ncbi:MAG: class I SAM-dependent methyltransferase [Rubrivivax sp.]
MRGKHRRGTVEYRRCSIGEMEGRYDFISFHHSLEHIPDQDATLRAARALLNDQGTCLVRVPVVPSYLWEKYGVCWMGLDAPRHLYLHTRESMRIAAERAGFVVERVFYDMDEVTLIASEQYLKDIPMFGERSYFSSPADSEITPAQVAALRSLAARLNAEERADCAAFVLKPA